MNTKILWITVIVFTVSIFAGNRYATRLGDECDGPCDGKIRITGPARFGSTEPTCSLKFSFSLGRGSDLKSGDCVSPGVFDRLVTCDPGIKATIKFKDGRTFCVRDGVTARFSCVDGKVVVTNGDCMKLPNRPGFKTRGGTKAAADEARDEIITETARIRVFDGEVELGLSPAVMLVTGEAEVQSFCTGDVIRLVGPSTLGLLPECNVEDVVGRWRGIYARRLENQPLQPVPFSLTLRNESGYIGGGVQTADGTFAIIDYEFDGSSLDVQAVRTMDDRYREIRLSGNVTKGDMVLDVVETDTTVTPRVIARGNGFAERLYIAESAVPQAVLNQPYRHTLLALSPSSGRITFRLVEGRLPRGITLDGETGTLSGTPTELGNFGIVIAATDAAGDVFQQRLSIAVKRLAVTTPLLPDALVGQRYAMTLKAAGGRPPYRWEAPLLPLVSPRFQLDRNTGELTGAPTRDDVIIPVLVKVTDNEGNEQDQELVLVVRHVTIRNSHFLPEATVGGAYRTQFQAVGNSSPVEWSITQRDISSIGLQLNQQTGELSGTPTKAGEFLLQVSARDRFDEHTREFVLTVNVPKTKLASGSAASALTPILPVRKN
jgi:hypothetical protein